MRYAKPLIASGVMLAAMFAAAFYAAAQLGDRVIAIHWGLSGQPDGYAPASWGVYGLPGVALLVTIFMTVLPPLMPKAGRLERSWPAFEVVWLAVLCLLLVVHLAMLGIGLGYNVPIVRVITVAVGSLLLVIGNLFGKIRYNFVFGIRTPWTLADERVWDHTHRFAGWAMALGGSICAAIGVLVPTGSEPMLVWLLIPCAVGPAVAATLYSIIESRRVERKL